MPIDSERLDAFLGKAVCDLGAATSATLMLLAIAWASTKRWRLRAVSAELAGRSGNERAVHREC